VDFGLFWDVWDLLKKKYVDKSTLDAREMLYGAINGMLAASGDPYTTFFDPKEKKNFEEEIKGSFEGIGAEMGIRDDILTIIAPLEGTPAEKAGLMAGDKILKIDDESTVNLSIDEAVSRIRGKKGTEVKLTIFRNGDEESRDITVPRAVIQVKSVRYEMKENGIFYVRLNQFGEETDAEFARALIVASRENTRGIILDLRNNPGGLLTQAVDIASVFLPQDTVVVIEEDADGKREEMRAKRGQELVGLPVAILINEGSASASEILAGALRENREDVRLIGKKSFGKGSVQEYVNVTRDTAVKITIAKWLTPNGNQINNVGIKPDEEVGLKREDVEAGRDPQLDKATEALTALLLTTSD
jgi:carboxyl-terminal processing protease